MKGPIRPVYKRETKSVSTDDSDSQLRKLFDELTGKDWLQQNCTTIENGARAVLRKLNLPDDYSPSEINNPDESLPAAARLARDAILLARWIANARAPTRDHLHNAVVLGGLYERLRVETDLAPLVESAKRALEGGARGGIAKQIAQAQSVTARWTQLEDAAKKLNGAGWDRPSILDALEKRGAKLGVKRSTIEKNPRIRQHLPRARRKSAR